MVCLQYESLPLEVLPNRGLLLFSPQDVLLELYCMCWTTEREASEAAVAVAADLRTATVFVTDQYTRTTTRNNSPVARPFARRYRHAVRSLVFLFVLFVVVTTHFVATPITTMGCFGQTYFIERKDSTNHQLCGSGVGSRDNKKHHHHHQPQPQPHRIGLVLC